MPVSVVRLNQRRVNFTTYIGREVYSGNGLPQSPFHNPFHIGKDGTRDEVIAKFAAYWYDAKQWKLRQTAVIMFDDYETLGCWCHPDRCHGDIIAGYVNWKRQEVGLWD